jgi:cell division protein FtsQ
LSLAAGPRVATLIETARHRISSMMLLEQVVWEEVGSTNLSAQVTKDLMWEASGLRLGQEMLGIDLNDLEKRLLSIPWVESAQIQKKLPSTLLVRYTVHHARAIGLRQGRPWKISSTGLWVAPVASGPAMDLPVLTGADTLGMELRWLDALERELNGPLLQIHEVNFSASSGKLTAIAELQFSSQSAKVRVLASGAPAQDTLNRLNRVVQYLIKNNILVSTIDLRPGKKVVVNVGKRP